MQRASMKSLRMLNSFNALWLKNPLNPLANSETSKQIIAAGELFDEFSKTYSKPEWKIEPVEINGEKISIDLECVWQSSWCKLIHFKKNLEGATKSTLKSAQQQPKVLLVAPLSGHFATLLRGTVQTFLNDHDVYITDWEDAKNVSLRAGRFGLDEFIDYIITMIHQIGKGVNVIGICQPGPPVLAAVAIMNEDNDECAPDTMCLVGSPIDARCAPTVTNKLAEERPFAWFKSNMIHEVPLNYTGAMRRVYPGFVQLFSFISMNTNRHIDAHSQYFNDLVKGDGESAQKHREFYNEYLSVLDLSEEFYLETIEKIFQEYHLPLGKFYYRDRLVKPETITKTALLTVEGELDDISGIGQTAAAHDLCSNLSQDKKEKFVQEGVGHYGVFNGRKFRNHVYPVERDFIKKHSVR